MSLEAWLLVIVLVPVLTLVATNKIRPDLAALGLAALLGLAQFFGMSMIGEPGQSASVLKAIDGFGQPVVITLIGLFIVTRCLEKTGITRLLARWLLRIGGASEAKLIALFAGATAFLSLFMNNLAAGALLLPSALEAARRTGIKPSKLLIPVSFGSLLGGAATYFTTANIIVSDLLRIADPPQAPLGVLDFTPTGGLIALAGIAFLALFGNRLLPNHEPSISFSLVRPTGSELEDAYQVGERLWNAALLEDSPFAGRTLRAAAFGERLGVSVVALSRGRRLVFPLTPDQVLVAGDVLWIVGRADRVNPLAGEGMRLSESHEHISELGLTFVEIVLAPRSGALGRTLKTMDFRRRYGFTAIALLRKGRSFRTSVADFPLEAGDSLLMAGEPEGLPRLRGDPNFIILEPNPADQPVHRREALLAGGLVLAAVAASIAGVPVYLSMLAGAVLVVLVGLLSLEEATRSVEWQAIFLIAGMYAVTLSMVHTGLAAFVGDAVVRVVTPLGSLGLAAGAFILTALLTQVMGGQVAALVTGPIAISAAIHLGISPQAIAVATAIGCSAGFFTPLAHPVNLLMIGPANYTFADFFKIGWPLSLVCFGMLLVGMKVFWGI